MHQPKARAKSKRSHKWRCIERLLLESAVVQITSLTVRNQSLPDTRVEVTFPSCFAQ
jgi:hypothetical protein